MLADRMERNHADLRHAIDNLILTDQAKRLKIRRDGGIRPCGIVTALAPGCRPPAEVVSGKASSSALQPGSPANVILWDPPY